MKDKHLKNKKGVSKKTRFFSVITIVMVVMLVVTSGVGATPLEPAVSGQDVFLDGNSTSIDNGTQTPAPSSADSEEKEEVPSVSVVPKESQEPIEDLLEPPIESMSPPPSVDDSEMCTVSFFDGAGEKIKVLNTEKETILTEEDLPAIEEMGFIAWYERDVAEELLQARLSDAPEELTAVEESEFEKFNFSKPITKDVALQAVYADASIMTLDFSLFNAEQVFVSSNGSDTSGDGTAALPFATIQKALTEVNVGGEIVIMADIFLNDTLVVDKNVRFVSDVIGTQRTLYTMGDYRHMQIASAAVSFTDISLKGFTGIIGGGILVSGSNSIVDGATITECSNLSFGSAIYITGNNHTVTNSNLTKNSIVARVAENTVGGTVYITGGGSHTISGVGIKNNEVQSNMGPIMGAGIFIDDAIVNMSNSEVSNNKLNAQTGSFFKDVGGAGIAVKNGSLTTNACAVSGNTIPCLMSSPRGGGIYAIDSTITINGGSVSNNTLDVDGSATNFLRLAYGAGVCAFGGELKVLDTVVSGNSITNIQGYNNGAGIAVAEKATLTLTDVTLSDNAVKGTWAQGGGVFADHASLYISNCDIQENTAYSNNTKGPENPGNAGTAGIFMNYATAEIIFSRIKNNLCDNSGAGILAYNECILTMTEVIVCGNTTMHDFGGGVGGSGGGGLALHKGVATLTDCAFYDNEADGGGAISVGHESELYIKRGKYYNNKAGVIAGRGGGLSVDNSIAVIEDAEIYGNEAYWGAGLYLQKQRNTNDPGRVTLSNCKVHDNLARSSGNSHESGGGLLVIEGEMILDNTKVYDNASNFVGGGISTFGKGTIKLKNNSAVYDNVAASSGGGINLEGISSTGTAYLELVDSAIYGNTAEVAGGVKATYNSVIKMIDSDIYANMAYVGSGGGILLYDSTLDVVRGDIYDNTANYDGGGIYTDSLANVTTQGVDFYRNVSEQGYAWRLMDPPTSGDSLTHVTNIHNTTYTQGYSNAYNNDDINYYRTDPLYKVTFDANGGAYSDGSTTYIQGGYLEGSLVSKQNVPALARNDYGFTGLWYRDAACTQLWNFAVDTMPAEDLVLYAGWQKAAFIVTFNANGGAYPDASMKYSKNAVPNTLLSTAGVPVPSRSGYTFTGRWYADAACTIEWVFSAHLMPARNLELFAGWKPVDVTPSPSPSPSPSVTPSPSPSPSPSEEPHFQKLPSNTQVSPGDLVDYVMTGFENNTVDVAYDYAITDIMPVGLTFVSAEIPAFTNAAGVTYNVKYITNKTGARVLQANVSAGAAQTISAPPLSQDEYITYLTIEANGTVPAGFGRGDSITITCRVAAEPATNTLINQSMVFFNDRATPGDHEEVGVTPPQDGPDTPVDGNGQGVDPKNPLDSIPLLGIPLAGISGQTWALLNLIIMLAGLVMAVVLIVFLFKRKRNKDSDEEEQNALEADTEEEDIYIKRRKGILFRALAIALSVIGLLLFILTENMRLPMVWTDNYTLWQFVVFLVEIAMAVAMNYVRRKKEADAHNDKEEAFEQ